MTSFQGFPQELVVEVVGTFFQAQDEAERFL